MNGVRSCAQMAAHTLHHAQKTYAHASKKCKHEEEKEEGNVRILKALESLVCKGSCDRACGVIHSVDLQRALLCLVADKGDQLPASLLQSGLEESARLRASVERVVIVWLADVPCSSSEEAILFKSSIATASPALEFPLACPAHYGAPSDAFLSGDQLEQTVFPAGRSGWTFCCKTDLLMGVKEMEQRGYPIPFPAEVKSDHDLSIKLGMLVFTFQWSGRRFVTRHKNFATCPKLTDSAPLLALDCEMVKTTTDDMALGRVSIVNEEMECIYETFVRPRDPVLDYMTRYSGITASHLEGVSTTVEDVQKDLLHLLPADAILVGQSLQNDLLALGYTHPYVIDTSVIFTSPHKSHTPSLAFLAKHILNVKMQRGKAGHNSEDDAEVSMRLVQAKLSAGHELVVAPGGRLSLFQVFSDFGVCCVMIDNTRYVKLYATGNTHSDKAENDHRALWCTRRLSETRFGWVQFHGFEQASQSKEKKKSGPSTKLSQMTSAVQSVIGGLPSKSVVFVVFGGRDLTIPEPRMTHHRVFSVYKQ